MPFQEDFEGLKGNIGGPPLWCKTEAVPATVCFTNLVVFLLRHCAASAAWEGPNHRETSQETCLNQTSAVFSEERVRPYSVPVTGGNT